MRRVYVLVLVFVTLGVVIAGCSKNRMEGTTASSQSDQTKMSDSDLKHRIQAKLNEDPQLRAADLSVRADSDDNTATVSGTVESEALRTRAIDLAKSAHLGLIITDKIDVKPSELARSDYTQENAQVERSKAKERGETIGDSVDDAWIHAKIVSKLIINSATPEHRINVDVDKGVVTLRGRVRTIEEKNEAVRTAKDTDGVIRVVDKLLINREG